MIDQPSGQKAVVIVGAGMIGLLTLQAARLAGAGEVAVLDIDDSRLELARSLGATYTFNSSTSRAAVDVLELTNGRGVDSAFECVGSPVTVKLAIEVVRKSGTVTLVANITPTVDIGCSPWSLDRFACKGLVPLPGSTLRASL